jgi:hypothetical protein
MCSNELAFWTVTEIFVKLQTFDEFTVATSAKDTSPSEKLSWLFDHVYDKVRIFFKSSMESFINDVNKVWKNILIPLNPFSTKTFINCRLKILDTKSVTSFMGPNKLNFYAMSP